MFGLTLEKLVIIAAIAAFLIGPQRLPEYAGHLARLVKKIKEFAAIGKDRIREEMGPDFDEVDWRSLDPRRYDPRSIIRSALADEAPASAAPAPAATSAATATTPAATRPEAADTAA